MLHIIFHLYENCRKFGLFLINGRALHFFAETIQVYCIRVRKISEMENLRNIVILRNKDLDIVIMGIIS